MNHVAKKQAGFTLIELMLAMTFIAFLLIAIAMTVIQASNVYNKGATVKDINQSSRTIANDIARSAAEARTIDLAGDYFTNSAGGRLCIGKTTYIWNTTAALEAEATDPNLTTYERGGKGDVRFVKIPDPTSVYCERSTQAGGGFIYPQIREIDTDVTQELLAPGDHKLGINKLEIPAGSRVYEGTTAQTLYTLNYVISSGKLSAMNDDQTACLDQGEPGSDLIYCNVHQFTIVLRTGNKDKVN